MPFKVCEGQADVAVQLTVRLFCVISLWKRWCNKRSIRSAKA